jgi:DNA repair exonuclease SbcCD ATPase subunit
MQEGFIDLRRNTTSETGADSFWPSFTDIMMVVVMIFMIASVVLMLRNWDLVQALRDTIESERAAEARALSMTETSATLEEQLAQAQHENSELRMRLMRANEISHNVREQLSQQQQQLLSLQAEKQQLTSKLQQAMLDVQLHEDKARQSEARFSQLEDVRKTLEQRLQQVLAQLAQAEQDNQEQASELAELRQGGTLTEQQLSLLQGEYDDLRVKYDKLVKPARSAQGKHVVTVRYWKEGKYYQIRVKDAGEDDYRVVTRKQLHEVLSDLKKRYGANLYVKLIIPDDSGLSYNEAWGFTFDILNKYDYYHQDDAQDAPAAE